MAILSNEGIKANYTYTGLLIAEVFILYLDTFVLPLLGKERTLIIDWHPVHRAKSVQNYLKKNVKIGVFVAKTQEAYSSIIN